jgi:hypothetical protein|tara:strand:+ start:391 stop:810 length:420 start_codon:yes stop_codon:yes gene_type:complete
MATRATITINSDISYSGLSLSSASTLKTAGTDTDISETTGLGKKKVATASNVVLLDGGLTSGIAADVTADKSAKVYVKNMNLRGNGTKYVTILLAAVEIGRLYGGDWMFIPWCAASGKDIEFTPSDATETTLEYTCFYE